jgi:hypothetical protein
MLKSIGRFCPPHSIESYIAKLGPVELEYITTAREWIIISYEDSYTENEVTSSVLEICV